MAINTTPFVSGSILTAAEMTNLPMGYLDDAGATATTAIVGGTNLAVLGKAMTISAGRLYRISAGLGFQPSANTLGNAMFFTTSGGMQKILWYRGDQIDANYPQYISGFYITTASALGVTTGTASVTFTLFMRCSGNGALNTNPDGLAGAGSAEQIFLIEDIGAE
jgi:hypothetical protein